MHWRQITFDYLDVETGEVSRGVIRPATREHLRGWLQRFQGREATFALEATTGWRFVIEEQQAAGLEAHVAEPAETRARRGPKRRAKTDRQDARHLRDLLQTGRLPESWTHPYTSGSCVPWIRDLVIEPAGMANTRFDADDVMTRRFVAGHLFVWEKGRNEIARPWGLPRAAAPAGGVISCAKDLAAYTRYHLGDDPILASMRTPQPPLGQGWTTGLDWFVREYAREPIAEHGGATLGQMCQLTLVPAHGYAVAVLTNSSRGGEVVRPVIRAALNEDIGLLEHEPEPIAADAERIEAVAGHYHGQLADYDLVGEGDGLVLIHHPRGGFPTRDSPPGPTMPRIRVRFSAPDRLIFLDPPLSTTLADVHWDRDRPDWIRIGSRVCWRDHPAATVTS